MSDHVTWIERLGREVDSAFVPVLDDRRRQAQKGALLASLAAVRRPARRRPRPALVLAAAACLAIVAAAGAIVGWRMAGSRTGSLRGIADVSVSGDGIWFETPEDSGLKTSFRDGSTVTLGKGTRARIAESAGAGEDRVAIVVAKGSLEASIRKGTAVRWEFGAGSYRMSGRGTRFSLEWDDEVEVMDLRVTEGLLLVTGAGIADDGIEVPAGTALRAGGKPRTVSMRSLQPGGVPQAAPDPGQQAGSQSALDATDREDASSAGQAGEASDRPVPEWKALAEKGQYVQAMKAAHGIGIDKLASTLQLPDLWILGDAARYSGDAKSARIVLLAIRDRFAKSQKARIAAYLLGRLSAESDEKHAEAVVWFKVYLKEDPGGPLAEEALGRLVDALLKCGRDDDAAAAAREYLDKYPDGIFSDLALSVAGR